MLIRDMTAADADTVAEIRVEGWRFAYAGIMPEDHLAALSVEENAARLRARLAAPGGATHDMVAVGADGAVAGWAAFGPYRADPPQVADPADSELYALYVRPAVVGTGVGRALTDAVRERARRDGYRRLLLWVVRDNARARRFYARAGFAPDGAEDPYVVDGVPVPELRYATGLVAGGTGAR